MSFLRSKKKLAQNVSPSPTASDLTAGSQPVSSQSTESDVALSSRRFNLRGFFRDMHRSTPSPPASLSSSTLAIQSDSADPSTVAPLNSPAVLRAEQAPSPPQSTAVAISPAKTFQTGIIPGISAGNRTANLSAVLSIIKSICEMLDNVPFAKVITGVLGEAVNIAQVSLPISFRAFDKFSNIDYSKLLSVKKSGTRQRMFSSRFKKWQANLNSI